MLVLLISKDSFLNIISAVFTVRYEYLQWGIAYCVKGGLKKEQEAMKVGASFPCRLKE
jgi:hypothetical protein